MLFTELGLKPELLRAVADKGYDTPTPIQREAIPAVLAGRDVLAGAQTGTGKTAAFTLPMLTRLEHGRARARMPRTLILEPTRELAAQVQESFEKYGAGQKLNVALVIGGVSFDDQDSKLTRGVDVDQNEIAGLLRRHAKGDLRADRELLGRQNVDRDAGGVVRRGRIGALLDTDNDVRGRALLLNSGGSTKRVIYVAAGS